MSGTNHELMTVREAAEFLDVVQKTVRRWMDDGLLPFEEIGPHKRKRLRETDVRLLRRRGMPEGKPKRRKGSRSRR